MSTLARLGQLRRTSLGAPSLALALLAAQVAHAQAPVPGEPLTPAAPLDAPPPPLDAPAADTNALAEPPATAPAEQVFEERAMDPAAIEAITGEGEGALTAEQMAELGFGAGEGGAVDTDFKLSGFADFTFSFLPARPSDEWQKRVLSSSSFAIGNFNIYLSKNLSERIRTMSEVRFHYAPHGSSSLTDGEIVNTYSDHADFNRPVHLGGIEIERIYLEFTLHPNLILRAGQFLTPYGIWNVDHGSPTYLPVQRPYPIGSALFPERQTGFELLGRWDASNDSIVGYHLTLSNGMGPLSEIRDLDENKGVGGRLFWEYRKFGMLRVGGSAFYATDSSITAVSGLMGGRLSTTSRIDAQSKVLALAGDVQWRYGGLLAQVEAITQQRKFTDEGRVSGTNPFTGQAIFPIDYTTWGVYGLLAYRFDAGSVGITPYVLVSGFDEMGTTFVRTKVQSINSGLNLRITDAVVLKFEYAFARFPKGHLISDSVLHMVQNQLAWAF